MSLSNGSISFFYSSQLFAESFDIEISGSVQSGYKLYDHYSFSPYFDQDSTQEFFSVARIIIEGDIYDQHSFELHAVQAYDYSNVKTGVGGRDTSMLPVDLNDDWINDADRSAYSYIDRANIKFSVQDLDIQVGRLATSFGKPTFWNLFDYYGNSYLSQEYKAGIDAIKIDKKQFADEIVEMNSELNWMDPEHRGYLTLEFKKDQMEAKFNFIKELQKVDSTISSTQIFQVQKNKLGIEKKKS